MKRSGVFCSGGRKLVMKRSVSVKHILLLKESQGVVHFRTWRTRDIVQVQMSYQWKACNFSIQP